MGLPLLAIIAGAAGLAFCDNGAVSSAVIEVPIHYAGMKGPDAPRDPVVKARVEGRDVLLLLDTGAGGIWLDQKFARGLRPKKPDRLRVRIGAWERQVPKIRSFAVPRALSAAGIAGVINPARLVDRGGVVLDLSGRKLFFLDEAAGDMRSWLAARYPRHGFEELKQVKGLLPPKDDHDQDFHTIVQGALVGYPEGPLLIDSGAAGILFRDNYVDLPAGTTLQRPMSVRIGKHEIMIKEAKVGPHRRGTDVIGSLGLAAIRELIIGLPVEGDTAYLGFGLLE